jgi:hypothetical protein
MPFESSGTHPAWPLIRREWQEPGGFNRRCETALQRLEASLSSAGIFVRLFITIRQRCRDRITHMSRTCRRRHSKMADRSPSAFEERCSRVLHVSDFPGGLDSDIRSRRRGAVVHDRVDEGQRFRTYKNAFTTSPGGVHPRGVDLLAFTPSTTSHHLLARRSNERRQCLLEFLPMSN